MLSQINIFCAFSCWSTNMAQDTLCKRSTVFSVPINPHNEWTEHRVQNVNACIEYSVTGSVLLQCICYTDHKMCKGADNGRPNY